MANPIRTPPVILRKAFVPWRLSAAAATMRGSAQREKPAFFPRYFSQSSQPPALPGVFSSVNHSHDSRRNSRSIRLLSAPADEDPAAPPRSENHGSHHAPNRITERRRSTSV